MDELATGFEFELLGLPCNSTMGSPSPTFTYAISLPRNRRRCFWYGNAAEITLPSPSFFLLAEYHRRDTDALDGQER